MNGTPPFLHEYSLDLVDYLRSNIRSLGRNEAAREWLKEDLPPAIFNFLFDESADALGNLLLGPDELIELQTAIEAFEPRATWEPYPPLHQRRVLAVAEIRKSLTAQDAEDWSRWSAEYASILEQPRLSLLKGTDTVAEWLRVAYRFLVGMRKERFAARPTGDFPTPLHNKPSSPENATSDHNVYVNRVRNVLKSSSDAPYASANAIVKLVGGNRQACLQAIDVLRQTGEYKNPRRSRQRRSNDLSG